MQTIQVTDKEKELIKLALKLAAEKSREIATTYSKLTLNNHPQDEGKKQMLENLYAYEDLLDRLGQKCNFN
ncbi:hypothetical protein [Bernardetia sp.]|uniref:hypothetical protein n=1 Tax=Bernardetia sp. TaxID=1937974 RepID=UPI0025B88F56|nr:hypothetical protein [Bernardetia sp.]